MSSGFPCFRSISLFVLSFLVNTLLCRLTHISFRHYSFFYFPQLLNVTQLYYNMPCNIFFFKISLILNNLTIYGRRHFKLTCFMDTLYIHGHPCSFSESQAYEYIARVFIMSYSQHI